MNKWILVADASRARIFSTDEIAPMKLVRELKHPASRATTSELVTDRRGSVHRGPGGNIGSAMEAPTPPHEVEAEKFAIELQHLLKKSREHNEFASLVLIAPPHFLGLLRKHMDAQVTKHITGSASKDLTHADESAISATLKEIAG